jgi:hypothetical protein
MRIAKHLTIQDYFKNRVSACFQPRTCNRMETVAGSPNSEPPFSKILAGAQTFSVDNARGLSIQDYMQRRIASRSSTCIARLQSTDSLQALIPESARGTPVDQNAFSHAEIQKEAPSAAQVPQANTEEEGKRKILASIKKAAGQLGLPVSLIRAVVKAESNYQVRALSPAGAQGLMQLMPETARELGVTDPFDIDQNIRAGAQYLRNMLDRFNGDIHLALSAYNAGPGTVDRFAGHVPYAETRTYVQRVLRYAERFSSTEVT